MPYIGAWGTDDRQSLLIIRSDVLSTFSKHAQHEDGAPEAGGVLLGYVRGHHLEVVHATEPTSSDTRMRFFFQRMEIWHAQIAHSRWADSAGLVRYLGEWHTHPEVVPNPSGLDLDEWRKLAAGRRDMRKSLGIIVGTEALHVELMGSDGARSAFTPIFEDIAAP